MPTRFLHFALASLLAGLTLGCHRRAPQYELVTAREDALRIDVRRVSDGQAHFFTYQHQSKNINFFIRTDREGTLRAHFDACYSCFKYKRGYVQERHEVVCLACRIGYDLDVPVWEFVGACVPITLKCRVQGSNVVLPLAAVVKGARFF